MADTAAVRAVKTISTPTINNISTSDVKNSIGKEIVSIWQNYWNQRPPSRNLYSPTYKFEKKKQLKNRAHPILTDTKIYPLH